MNGPPAALAARHGLTECGTRPGLAEYVRQLWGRRHFVLGFSRAQLHAQYSHARLGQWWQVATPLLNAAVFYLIFGKLVGTGKGVPDFVPFLVTGVFVFAFTQSSVLGGTRSISGNLRLVQSVHFPRASLPISLCLTQLQQMLYSMAVLVAIVLAWGERPCWAWLLALPALLLQYVFTTGLALVTARLGSRVPDLAQLMPFVLRTWMYGSGVMYSIDRLTAGGRAPGAVRWLLEVNPAAIHIDLMRFALIDSFRASGHLPSHVWAWAVGWAVLVGVGGFVFFWKAEERYGRG
ncbi:ABC transporter permease [Streptomyces sp. NPDC047108]|uniref:ABC transporter permease n=1 Tax=Streptomyces sp. NPDC047108 TaxID=3155025 RepID=UPI0033D2A849